MQRDCGIVRVVEEAAVQLRHLFLQVSLEEKTEFQEYSQDCKMFIAPKIKSEDNFPLKSVCCRWIQ